MSEYLLVRLSNQPQTKVHWWIGSDLTTSVEKQGELASWEDVGELAEEVEQRPVIVLVSGADVVLKEVTLPSGRARQFEKMLPYLIEDELAQDADTLHFSVLSKRGERVFTAAIDQHWMTTVLAQFEAAGMIVDKMLPDVLALPETEGASALQLGDEWLIRQGEFRGLCIENAWMQFFCRDESGSETETETEEGEQLPALSVTCYSQKPDLQDNPQQVWTEEIVDSVFSILLKGALTSPVTLLTGQFKKSSSWVKSLRLWRKTAVALVALILLSVASYTMEIYQMESKTTALRTESERIFRTLFPERKKIPTVSYLKRQINNELASLSGGGNDDSIMTLFDDLSKNLGNIKDLQLQRIHYDAQQGTIRVDVVGDNFQSFEAAQKKLAQTFDVQQGPLNRNDKQVLGFYTLKRK